MTTPTKEQIDAYVKRLAEEFCVGSTDDEPYSEYEGAFFRHGATHPKIVELYRAQGALLVLGFCDELIRDRCEEGDLCRMISLETKAYREKIAKLLAEGE